MIDIIGSIALASLYATVLGVLAGLAPVSRSIRLAVWSGAALWGALIVAVAAFGWFGPGATGPVPGVALAFAAAVVGSMGTSLSERCRIRRAWRCRRRLGEALRKTEDAPAGLVETGVVAGERQAQVAGRAWPEAVEGQGGDRLPLEEVAREFLGAQAGGADVQQHEHAALGQRDLATGRCRENAGEQRGATLVILAQRRDLGQVALERDEGAVLDEGRTGIEHAQHQVEEMAGERGRADDPADAEAGHGVRLGQARDDDGALGHAGKAPRADMRAGEGKVLVDLVRQQPQIVASAQPGDRLDLAPAQPGSGPVVRAVDPHHG